MGALLLKVWKWILKIPVLFAHFPGPTLMLIIIASIAVASASSCVTHVVETAARAELETDLAECKAGHSDAVAMAATERAEIIGAAAARQAAYDEQNRAAWLAAMRMLTDRGADDAALAALTQSIEGLKRDPRFACRLLPLPEPHLDRLRIGAERPHPTETGSH